MTGECWWRVRCATCAHYRETMAFGVGVGVCTQSGATVAESDTCEKHEEPKR